MAEYEHVTRFIDILESSTADEAKVVLQRDLSKAIYRSKIPSCKKSSATLKAPQPFVDLFAAPCVTDDILSPRERKPRECV